MRLIPQPTSQETISGFGTVCTLVSTIFALCLLGGQGIGVYWKYGPGYICLKGINNLQGRTHFRTLILMPLVTVRLVAGGGMACKLFNAMENFRGLARCTRARILKH